MKKIMNVCLSIYLLLGSIDVVYSEDFTIYHKLGNAISENGSTVLPAWDIKIMSNGDFWWGYTGLPVYAGGGMGNPYIGPSNTFPYPLYKHWVNVFDKIIEWDKVVIDKKMTIEKEMPKLWDNIRMVFISEDEGKKTYMKIMHDNWGVEIVSKKTISMDVTPKDAKELKRKLIEAIEKVEAAMKRNKDADKLLK